MTKMALVQEVAVFPEVLHKFTGGVGKELCYIVIESVHVFDQPWSSIVVYLKKKKFEFWSKFFHKK